VSDPKIPITPEEQRALSGIIADLDRVLDVSSRFIPEVVTPHPKKGSQISDAYIAKQRDAFEIARVLLLSAQDHLGAIAIIAKAGTLPQFALYTLLRGAAEAVVRARHLLDVDPSLTSADRLGRALNERLRNVEEAGKLDSASATYATKRVPHLESRAAALGINVVRNKKSEIIGFGTARPSILELFDRYLPAGKTVFRYLSAFAHSEPWALIPKERAKPSAEPGINIVSTEVNTKLVLTLLVGVASLFDEAVGYWVILAGVPLEVWRLAKQPPSSR
jgi:hypothetical protein